MKRREFITLLGGTVIAWPLAARAQQVGRRPARIGFLRASPPPEGTMAALRRGLAQQGYEEEKNFILVPGWADGDLSRLPELAKALVTNGVDLILTDGTVTARAARDATATVPIVMAGGLDPIQAGLAESLSRPGGNVTGFTTQTIDVTGKMFEILAEIMRGLGRVGVINPRGVGTPFRPAEAKAAQALGLDLKYIEMDGPGAEAIDAAMRQTAGEAQAAVMRGTPFFSSTQRKLIVEGAAAHRLPTIYETREFVELGGLVSYGTDFAAQFHHAAAYIAKILNGKSPAELPIEQATKFELVINLKATKALGLEVPPTLLARADEVIE
jgi:putative tryptophan/tyrosine transport system substrate-binding protein